MVGSSRSTAAPGSGRPIPRHGPASPGGPASPTRAGRPGRPLGPRPDPDERRALLLAATRAAIADLGPDASMAAIAERAGFAKPVLYATFADKAALAAELGATVAAELRASIMAGVVSASSPEAGLRLAIDAFCRFAEAETALFRFLVQGAAGFGRAFGERQLPAEVGDAMTDLIAAGLRQAGADPAMAPAWGYAVMGAVFMAADWWVDTHALSRAELVDHLTSLLWEGMGRAVQV